MKPKPFQLTSNVLVLDADDRVLLLRRSQASKHFPGAWDFPGGKPDPGETFEQALLREVAEETGLSISLTRVLGAGELDLPEQKVAYLFLEARHVNGAVRLSDEHDAFIWVAPSELPEQDLAPQFREFARAYAERATQDDIAEHSP